MTPSRLLSCLVLLTAYAFAASKMRPLTAEERIFLPYQAGESYPLGKNDWRIAAQEVREAIAPDYDDSGWFNGQAECSLAKQGFNQKIIHTIRKSFDLPDGWAGHDLLLDLGYISFYDEVFLNGLKVGGFGTYPKGILGSSWVRRRYVLPASQKLLKTGRNQLTLFVYPGSSSGMYQGLPALCRLEAACYPSFNLKTPGAESLAFNLSDASHLNRYRPGVPLNLEMSLSCVLGERQDGVLRATLLALDGHPLQQSETSGTIAPGMKVSFSPIKLTAPTALGEYTLRLAFHRSDGSVLWQKDSPLSVTEAVRFQLPVDSSIPNVPQQFNVSQDSTGHFGPRHHKDGKLVYDLERPDTRGGLAFSVRPMPEAPLLLMANVCPSPRNAPAPKNFLDAKGYQYDGFLDGWILGSIAPARHGPLQNVEVRADWGEMEWSYRYENASMRLQVSTVHPAFRASSSATALRIFEGANHYGTGLPTRLAGMTSDGLLCRASDQGFPFEKLTENWLLVWFSGNPAYGQFDIPWLLVFQHRPVGMKLDDSLEFAFDQRGAGDVLGMPLHGVTLQRPAVTEKWHEGLPGAVIDACRLWSGILAAAPSSPVRTVNVDFAADLLTVHDHFRHHPLNDDWHTPAKKVAPIYPILPLALSTGTIQCALHAKAEDLSYATLHGPLFATLGEGVTFQFRGLLHFVSEVRQVSQPPSIQLPKEMLDELDHSIQSFLRNNLNSHPAEWLNWRGKYVPGNVECDFSDLLDACRYLSPERTRQVKESLRQEVEPWFLFHATLPEQAGKYLLPRLRAHPVAASVMSPTGKKLTTFHPNEDDFGIDSCCWESLLLYAIWNYARTCDRFSFVQDNWDGLRQHYQLIPNSHDWPIGISYDTFSGIRIGNGLQETGIMHAGMCAMARMAHQLQDFELRDRASYYAVMQLAGLVGAMSANQYLRDWRPTVAGNNRDDEVQFCEYYRRIHYAEFNENGGSTQYVMNSRTSLNSASSYIMTPLPEVMRPYLELFSEQTDDFFDLKYGNIPFNRSMMPISPRHRLYMIRNYPLSAMELLNRRRHSSKKRIEAISDICATLDSLGKVSYKKLWNQ